MKLVRKILYGLIEKNFGRFLSVESFVKDFLKYQVQGRSQKFFEPPKTFHQQFTATLKC